MSSTWFGVKVVVDNFCTLYIYMYIYIYTWILILERRVWFLMICVEICLVYKFGDIIISRSLLSFVDARWQIIRFDFIITNNILNSIRPNDKYMRQQSIPLLLQIMARRQPLSIAMVVYCKLDHKEHISIEFCLKLISFRSRKCMWKCRLQNWQPSYRGLSVLSMSQLEPCY